MKIILDSNLEKGIWGLLSVTHKQKSIMLLYSRGYSYNDISKILGITVRQVRYGLTSLKTNKEVYELLH